MHETERWSPSGSRMCRLHPGQVLRFTNVVNRSSIEQPDCFSARLEDDVLKKASALFLLCRTVLFCAGARLNVGADLSTFCIQ